MSGKPEKPDNAQEFFTPEELSALAKFAMDNAPDSVIWVNHEGRIVYVNDAACVSLGYTREELLRMTLFDIDPDFPAEDYETHREYMRKHKWRQFETRHRAKDGRIFPVEVRTNYNEYKGKYLAIASDRDISERKQAEAALKASEEKYKAIFNNAPIGVFRTTVDGRVVDVNPALARMYGAANPEEMLTLTKSRAEALYANPSQRKEFIDALLKSPDGLSKEIEFRRRDGTTFPAILNASIQRDDDGESVFLNGTVEDITEWKRAEEELRKREALLAEVSRLAKIGGWEFDLVANKANWSQEFFRILEISPDSDPPSPKEFVNRYVRPEARAKVLETLERAVNHGESVDLEYSIHLSNDKLIWIRSIAHPEFEDGKCVRLFGAIQDITERKQAEEDLRFSEEKYRAIFNNAPVGVFRNTFDGRIVDVNPAMVRMFGFTDKDELISAINFQADNAYADATGRNEYIKNLLKSPEGLFSELEFKRPDGTTFLGFVYTSVQFDAKGKPAFLNGTVEDITERKQAEKALRLSEEKFSTLFRHSPDSISLSDLKTGAIVDANEAFLRRAARPREEVIGKTTEELGLFVSNDDRERFWAQLTRDGRVESFEADFTNEQGESGTFSVSGAMVEIEGMPYLLTIGRDVTAIKRMQEMMVQTEKMLSVGGIAAGVAHEINNPLGIVLQAAQNLELRSRPDFYKNKAVADELGLDMELMAKYMRARKLDVFIEDIRYAAQRASIIIRHLLNFSRRSESRRSVCGIKTIVNGAIALANSDFDLRKSYDFKKIDLKVSVDKNLPEIHCTETEIEQVILNLLRNAAQAMAEADPPIKEPRIDIRVTSRDDWVRLEVEDNGPGMSKDLQQRVFEPFFTTKGPGVGTGLGLSVSYFIITTGHSGKFTVASTPGSGTLFTIELPTESMREALQ